jgi:hypothetical protein
MTQYQDIEFTDGTEPTVLRDRQCCDGLCAQGRCCPYREASTPTPDLWPRPKASALVQATAIATVAVMVALIVAEVVA